MAIGTPVAIGTANTTSGNAVLTTTGAAPANSVVFFIVGWSFSSAVTLTGVTGGSLTWTIDYQQPFSGVAEWGYALVSAQAPAGLGSSAVLTGTYSGVVTASMIAGAYCTGLATSGVADVHDGQGQGAATNWDTTATSTTFSDTLVLGGSIHDGLATNTPTGGASALSDFQNATEAWSMCVEYKILASIQSTSLTGTWSSGANNVTNAFVAYKGVPAGIVDTTTRRYQIRRSRGTSW